MSPNALTRLTKRRISRDYSTQHSLQLAEFFAGHRDPHHRAELGRAPVAWAAGRETRHVATPSRNDGVEGARTASAVKMVVVKTPSEGKPSMGKSIRNLSTVTRVGLDLAKQGVSGSRSRGEGRDRCGAQTHAQPLIPFFAELPPCVVAMEACSWAHHWGRALIELGHEVRLIPPAHVKPYVRRNKKRLRSGRSGDYEARSLALPAVCAGAFDRQPGRVGAPSGARVARRPAHGGAQCFAQPSGRDRPHRAAGRVSHAYGLKRMAADGFNENGEIVVPDCVRGALRSLVGQIDALDEAIGAVDRELAASVKADETAKRLMTIPGVGPVTASAIVATIPDAGAFASGREFAAFLGLTSRQNRPGAKAAGKHHQDGRPYLRKLLVVGACATLRHRQGHSDALRVWASGCSIARRSSTSSS